MPETPAPASRAGGVASADVVEALVSLTGTLVDHHDTTDLLGHLAEQAVHLLGATAAGVLLPGADGRLELVAAAGSAELHRDVLRQDPGDGPLQQCLASGETVVSRRPDDAEQRWPRFARVLSDLGLAGVVVTPLWWREESLGVLAVVSTDPEALGPAAVRAAQGLADIATLALVQDAAGSSPAPLAVLQGALDARILVQQARGLLAAQRGTDVDEAFEVLRRAARDRGTHLADLARDLVEGRVDGTALDAPLTPPG